VFEVNHILHARQPVSGFLSFAGRNGGCDAAFNSEARHSRQGALSFSSVSVITNALRLRSAKL